MVGIDVYEGYRNPIWDYVYNDIRIGSAHELLPTLGEFDVILIADVIEHLDRPTARELVVAALSRSQILILSTPRHFAAQLEHAVEANTFEAHRILWTRDDFPADTHVVTINGPVCDVFVSSTNPMNPAIVPGKLYLDGRFSFDKVRFLCRKLVHSSKPL